MRPFEIKTIEEVKERCNRLTINLSAIKNKEGKENVKKMIDALKCFIENPSINLENKIDDLPKGTRRQTFRWIKGEVM